MQWLYYYNQMLLFITTYSSRPCEMKQVYSPDRIICFQKCPLPSLLSKICQ